MAGPSGRIQVSTPTDSPWIDQLVREAEGVSNLYGLSDMCRLAINPFFTEQYAYTELSNSNKNVTIARIPVDTWLVVSHRPGMSNLFFYNGPATNLKMLCAGNVRECRKLMMIQTLSKN